MARPQRKPNASQSASQVSSNDGELAKQLYDHLVKTGMSNKDAWEKAGDLLSLEPYSAQNRIGIISPEGYNGKSGKDSMAVAEKKRPRVHKANGKAAPRLGRVHLLPQGSRWYIRFARGLARWREQQRLTVKEAAAKYGLQVTAWYRIEQAISGGLTGCRADEFCETIGVEFEAIYQLGKPE